MPKFEEEDLGLDERKVIPRFPDPHVVRFRAGEDMNALAKTIVKSKQIMIDAAPGAGKSIDMPVGLVNNGISLLVHVVPATQLAATTHDRVAEMYPDAHAVRFATYDRKVEFPHSGLVIVSANVLVCYMGYWRGRGDDSYHMCLYLDEVHSSDAGTAVLRELKTAAPGVDQFMQATATWGNGGPANPFRALVTKGELRQFTYTQADPNKWDMNATGVPWSMKSLKGDFLIFVDNDDHAAVIKHKFEMQGVECFRFDSRTDGDKFLQHKKQIEARRALGGVVSAFLVDSTYGDGQNFPSVTRGIDLGKVRVLVPGPGGMPKVEYRDMYMAEYVQRASRFARIAGQGGDYWRPNFEPKCATVLLTTYEADAACIFYRMLGFQPPSHLEGAATFEGKVPRHIMSIMTGFEPIRRYYGCPEKMVDWPGNPVVIPELVIEPPVSIASSESAPSRPQSYVSDGSVSSAVEPVAGNFADTRDLSDYLQSVPGEDCVPKPRGFRGSVINGDVLPEFDKLALKYTKTATLPKCGEYCYVPGAEMVGKIPGWFPKDYGELWSVIEGISPGEYARTLGAERPYVVKLLLDTYNGALALRKAAVVVMDGAEKHMTPDQIDCESVMQWLTAVRTAWTRAGVRLLSSYEYLLACATARNMRHVAEMDDLESEMAKKLMAMLEPVLGHGPERPGDYSRALQESANVPWPSPSGNYQVSWAPKGVMERVAMKMLGGPPTATVIFESAPASAGDAGW